jgi:hypothetical protein
VIKTTAKPYDIVPGVSEPKQRIKGITGQALGTLKKKRRYRSPWEEGIKPNGTLCAFTDFEHDHSFHR